MITGSADTMLDVLERILNRLTNTPWVLYVTDMWVSTYVVDVDGIVVTWSKDRKKALQFNSEDDVKEFVKKTGLDTRFTMHTDNDDSV